MAAIRLLLVVFVYAMTGGLILAALGVVPFDGRPWPIWQIVVSGVLGWGVWWALARLRHLTQRARVVS